MPHIVVEATPAIADALDFAAIFDRLHRRIAGAGYAVLDDFKSRVHVTAKHLAGTDPAGEFIVVRLMTTNPRPEAEQHAMSQMVHDAFRSAIERLQPSYWWQCCVFMEPFLKSRYTKTDSHA